MQKNAKQNKIFFILAAIFFLLSALLCLTFGETLLTHTHEDKVLHADCAICRQISDESGSSQSAHPKTSVPATIVLNFLPVFAAGIAALVLFVSFTPVKKRDKLTI